MIVGKVVGSVVSTRKSDKLIGQKFMIVEPVHHMKADLSQIVAIDIIGAGIGEYVLVAHILADSRTDDIDCNDLG